MLGTGTCIDMIGKQDSAVEHECTCKTRAAICKATGMSGKRTGDVYRIRTTSFDTRIVEGECSVGRVPYVSVLIGSPLHLLSIRLAIRLLSDMYGHGSVVYAVGWSVVDLQARWMRTSR